MQPAWFQIGPSVLHGEDVWYEPPADRVNLQPPVTGTILQRDDLTSGFSITFQAPNLWPVSDDVISAGSGVRLVDSLDAPLVTVGWSRYQGLRGFQTLNSSGTSGLTLLRNDVPFDGLQRPTLLWEGSAGLFNFSLQLDAFWDIIENGVTFVIASAQLDRFTGSGIFDSFVVELTLNDESTGFVETTGPNVTFGTSTTSASNPIPSAGGGEAVENSQATFGVLEERINVEGYVLDAGQALLMGQGLVLANLTPRAIRTIDLGWRGSTVALFDDRGRLFGMPDGKEGLLVGVEYQDDFIGVTGGKRVRVEELTSGIAGSVPTDSEWLLNDDGSFWTNEDGTNSEVA
jgi:hypothetical protein